MENVFIQLALILLAAFVITYVARLFKQPVVIGYILTGILISPFLLGQIDAEFLHILSELGIAFLLFIVGLHLNPKVIKEVGIPSLTIGLVQIGLTFGAGFLVAFFLLETSTIIAAYVGLAMAFSSTIIIMKLLSDKHHVDSLYGKISIGILIIQDIVAVIALMVVSSSSQGTQLGTLALKSFVSGTGLILLLFAFGYLIIPRMTRNIAKSQELLFLFSICWCFAIAALFSYLGFSIEIGALLAGVILSISPYSVEISSKIRPLRDFFLIIFFIILGLNVQLSNIGSIIAGAVMLSIIALLLKPVIIMFLMKIAGYTQRTNFFVGTTLGQISEFSLILLALGVSVGHIPQTIMSTVTLAAIITITISTYMINYSNGFFERMKNLTKFFERKKIHKKIQRKRKKYHAILFGYNRIGFNILKSLDKIKRKYLVVDFNPDVINALQKSGIPVLYGDAYDQDLLEELNLAEVNLAVSTIPDFETNVILIETLRKINPKAIVITRAHKIDEALELYKRGASYVLTPHFLGGEYIGRMIQNMGTHVREYKSEKEKHIKMLEQRKQQGHEHPEIERN